MIDWNNEDDCLKAVRKNGWSLIHVESQALEIYLEAVKNWGRMLKYVKEQTIEIVMEGILQDGHYFKFERLYGHR